MKLSIQRETLLKPLQMVSGVVEKKQTMAILGNARFQIQAQQLSITATDTEVELISRTTLDQSTEPTDITVPARKLIDICRSLPDSSALNLSLEDHKLKIQSGRSRFVLSTLSADDFPSVDQEANIQEFSVPQSDFKALLQKVAFAMAQSDVRYYLNGLLLSIQKNEIKAIATDGHRLAMSTAEITTTGTQCKVIIPRKGVLELLRLLESSDQPVKVSVSNNHIRATTSEFTFTSKLIEGATPNYESVIPKNGNKHIELDRDIFKSALQRVAILCNEQFRGVALTFSKGELAIKANNPEQEEAEDTLNIDYDGETFEICFNVGYVLDALNVIESQTVMFTLADSESSALLEPTNADGSVYVVMPMKI